MAYKHVIRSKTKNLLTDEMFTSAGFTKQPDGSWYVSHSVVLNNKVMWENTEGIVGPITMSFYGKSSAPYYAGVVQWLVEEVDGTISYRTPTGTSSEWVYGTWTFDSKTVSKVYWVNITNRPLYLRDVMFEWGSTPTPYTPYNYLQSNKRMIKVSNVCQLLDKDNLDSFVVGNLDKITVTNNQDGTFIINGSYSNTYNSWYILNEWNIEKGDRSQIVEGHKYLLLGDVEKVSGDIHLGIVIWYVDGSSQSNYAGIITSLKNTKLDTVRVQYSFHEGDTADNAISKPQLFDLTEMYGAGHEPATVAEFRQRFPNELYPYSPQCWLTSYRSAVVCKTKNLFDMNNAAPYAFYDYNPPSDQLFVKDGIYTTRMNNYNIGSGLRIKGGLTLPAGVYTLSVKVVDSSDFGTGGYANIGFYYKIADGTWHVLNSPKYSYAPGTTLSFAINIPEHIELRLYLNYQNMNGQFLAGYISYKDIQLEQGSTATSYVPYQHL